MTEPHPVEAFLDDLHTAARQLPAREARQLIAEAEAHLYDATADLMRDGVPEPDAQRQAVARYGNAATLVRAEQTRSPLSQFALAQRVVASGLRLGSIGAILVGLSGVVSAVIYWIGGSRALVGIPPGTTLSAGDCTRWAGPNAGAAACRAAAISDWTGETIYYRIALGILGALVLLALRASAHWRGRGWSELGSATTDTIAVTLLIAGGVWTLGLGVDAAVVGGGAGQWFSGAGVALAAAAYYGVRVSRRLRGARIPGESWG